MKRTFAFVLIAFALVTVTVSLMTISSPQAFACEGDHRGS